MNKHMQSITEQVGRLAEEARALLAATADVAGERVEVARQGLASALDDGKELTGRFREKASVGTRATDEAVREHPYQVLGIALGVGALLGYLIARSSPDRD